MSLLWARLTKNLYVIGALVLSVLAVIGRMQFLKNSRDRAELKADTLRATVHAERVKKEVIKEEEKRLSSRRASLIKELKEEGENFEGVDNLTDSNDY